MGTGNSGKCSLKIRALRRQSETMVTADVVVLQGHTAGERGSSQKSGCSEHPAEKKAERTEGDH